MKKVIFVFVFIVLVIIAVAAYLGYVPGISNKVGIAKARDLGVRYTEEDLNKAREITGVLLVDLESENPSITFEGEKDISGEFTSEMITAMINEANYRYYPLSNTQVKIHQNGTIETSGNLIIEKVVKWSDDIGGDTKMSEEAKSYLKFLPPSPAFYLNGRLSVTDNQIAIDISEAKVAMFSATPEIISQYQDQLADFIEHKIASVPGMTVRKADFSEGKLQLDATYPEVEKSLK
jgi:hypothetical protein